LAEALQFCHTNDTTNGFWLWYIQRISTVVLEDLLEERTYSHPAALFFMSLNWRRIMMQ
jgi:hypothetical protein